MQLPSDFNDEMTYQNTGFTHPHENGVTWTNEEFEGLFINRLWVPNYIYFASNKKMSKDKIVHYVELLTQNKEFVSLGLFYCRCKAILMMFEQNATFMDDYRQHLHTKRQIILKRNFLEDGCINYILNDIPTQAELSVAFEYARVVSQGLLIHIIHATIEKKEYADPADDKHFLNLVKKYNKAYKTAKTPMITWQLWAVGFLVNFGASLCYTDKLFDASYELLGKKLDLII